jgi:arylsulfatase A-like enzyme
MGEAAARPGGLGLALTGLWVVALLLEQREPTPQVDDAYISYRYAANWLDGHGLVFNPGEYVEGFTNPLWVGLVALGMALSFEANTVGHALGLLSAAAACLCTFLYARALAPALPSWVAGLAPALLLASASFVRWTTGGLETPLFAAGATAALASAARDRIGWLSAALIATTLARPEGALVAGVLYAGCLFLPQRRAAALAGAFVYLGFLLVWTAARMAYYGEPLPNTFFAKVSGVPLSFGLLYLWGFLRDGALLLLPPAVLASRLAPSARPGAALVLLFGAYVVLVGGDLLGESRFLVPLLPALAALAVVGAGLGWQRRPALGALAAACFAGALVVQVAGPGPPGEGTRRARVLEHARKADLLFERAGRRRAEVLLARGDADARVATGAIGSFGYHSRLPIVDILGLTDPEIARTPIAPGETRRFPGHGRSNAAYVMSREPEYILIRRRDTAGAGHLRAVAELWQRPELSRDYAWDEELRAYRRLAPALAERADLLLVVVDTLRADRLGSYGAERDTSPALDRLAAEGVRFERAYAPAPWTKPSVASIFTGLHPSAHRANRVRTALPDGAVTLAEILREQGYRTAGVVSHDVLAAKNGFAQGFERYFEDEARGHGHLSTEGVTARARALLAELAAGEEPFFLFVHYFDPHYDYLRHPEFGFAAERAGRLDGSESLVSLRKLSDELTPEEVGLLRDLYDEEIRFTDRGIGHLLEGLAEAGRAERSLVVATADHGEAFLEHGWLGHTRSLYEVLLRVPLILRVPGVAPGVVAEPVSTVSLLPTLLELMGVRPDEIAPHGPSLAPHLTGAAATQLPPVFAEVDFLPVFDPAKRAAKKALIGPRFKLIRDERSGALELYDLSEDPGERRDLAGEDPERLEKLRAQLEIRARAAGAGALSEQDREPTLEELERLRALGYGGS